MNKLEALNRKLPATRLPIRPRIRKVAFLKALEGTWGNKSEIARRLGCCTATVKVMLAQDGWDDVRQAFKEEEDRIIDTAKTTIQKNMTQRLDLRTAQRAAEYWLDRTDPDFKPTSKVEVEGGANPVRVAHLHISLDTLQKLPIETRRQLLEAMERGAELPAEFKAPPPPEDSKGA